MMPKRSIREVGEAVALVGVIASLVFVGLELRETRIAARAAAYQELGIAVADNWMGRANDRVLNDLVHLAMTADSATWSNVSASDAYLLRSYVLANVRLYETVYLQVEQGLLRADALANLGWVHLLNSKLLARLWPDVRPAVTPAFAAHLEREQPALRDL
jgi:hypothetical protein